MSGSARKNDVRRSDGRSMCRRSGKRPADRAGRERNPDADGATGLWARAQRVALLLLSSVVVMTMRGRSAGRGVRVVDGALVRFGHRHGEAERQRQYDSHNSHALSIPALAALSAVSSVSRSYPLSWRTPLMKNVGVPLTPL